jgi:succinate-semialdehyde dehydrogenase/glutarate-semialdehyde dehydrogenase
LKPSEVCPGSTLLFNSLFLDAGFPEHVYQTALVSTAQVSSYIADPRIRAITLTGSDRAGSAIGEQAGRHIKPVVLELGGSDAFIVLDSADVAKAAGTAMSCQLMIGGQVCISPKRIILTEAVADEFTTQFVDSFTNQVAGDPFDPATTVGPLSSSVGADALQAQYQDALDKGATVLVPGGRVDGPGAFFEHVLHTCFQRDLGDLGPSSPNPGGRWQRCGHRLVVLGRPRTRRRQKLETVLPFPSAPS